MFAKDLRKSPRFPVLGRAAGRLARPLLRKWFAARNVFDADSPHLALAINRFRVLLARGETAYLAGVTPAGHDSGVALVEVSPDGVVRLLANDEEERFVGVKHYGGRPERSLQSVLGRLAKRGVGPDRVAAWLGSWDYAALGSAAVAAVAEQFPSSLRLLRRASIPNWPILKNLRAAASFPQYLAQTAGVADPISLLVLPHHENHAALAYATSPFFDRPDPVLISVIDAFGDSGSTSLYVGSSGQLRLLYDNHSPFDSIGNFYSLISSTEGGWPTLASEGRYMGAAAWGDARRESNPYYRRLRELFLFEPEGRYFINRRLANWQNGGELTPFSKRFYAAMGRRPTPLAKLAADFPPGGDCPLSAELGDAFDLAAAAQLVFEDALMHVLGHFLRVIGCDRLVLSGGTALNCVATLKLTETFDRAWFREHLGKESQLQVWVPPVPGDAGVAAGAAYNFALRAGLRSFATLSHAFYCGRGTTNDELAKSLDERREFDSLSLGRVADPRTLADAADLLAWIVSHDGVVGLFQGVAETGPRALGHRSFLADAGNPATLRLINEQVKFREWYRPLGPIITIEHARKWFYLADAPLDDLAYRFMTLAARARPGAKATLPAVIHRDGTCRIQIVPPDDRLTYAFLKSMGRYAPAEAAVNTSFNVRGPIVQSPAQALDAVTRARAVSAVLFLTDEADARLVWEKSTMAPKDGGRRVLRLVDDWARRNPGHGLRLTADEIGRVPTR